LLPKKKKAMLSMSMPMATQSSASSASLTRPQNKKKTTKYGRASTPPCSQPCTPENADGHNDDAASQKSDMPIELSDSDEEDWVEVVEDDDDELGACDVLNLFQRSVN
jgi:hypothetical protein